MKKILNSLMRAALTFVAVILGCVHLKAAEPVLQRRQIEKDLALLVSLKSPKIIRVGELVDVGLILRNQSRGTAYPIVVPGDGSEVGWREPYVYFTATLDTGNGDPKAVPAARYARCGIFEYDWQKDIRILKPDEELPLKDWVASPSSMLEFQSAGHVRMVAHYSYRAGVTKGGAKQPVVAGAMAGIPAFEVVSAPVEFDVVRPLDLVLTVKAPLTVKTKAKISELFDIRLVNRSKQPVEISSPTISADARLLFEIEGEFVGWRPSIDKQRTQYGEKISLKPGEEVSVLGTGAFANDLDGTWEYPVKGTIKLRATFYSSASQSGPVIMSNWVEVKAVDSKGDGK